jgi:hypothetical protein
LAVLAEMELDDVAAAARPLTTTAEAASTATTAPIAPPPSGPQDVSTGRTTALTESKINSDTVGRYRAEHAGTLRRTA